MASENQPVEVYASSRCDICGIDVPHSHSDAEVKQERFIRPAFEKHVLNPPEKFRLERRLGPFEKYWDSTVERLWLFFISGWLSAENHALELKKWGEQ